MVPQMGSNLTQIFEDLNKYNRYKINCHETKQT